MTVYTSPWSSSPAPETSLFSFLFTGKNAHPGTLPAFVDGTTGRVLTRQQFQDDVLSLAWGLRNVLNLQKGETALVFSPNSLLFPVVSLALVASGIRASFTNTGYSAAEFTHQYTDSRASRVFAHPALLPIVLEALKSEEVARERIVVLCSEKELPTEYRSKGLRTIDSLMAHGEQLVPEDFSGAKAHETTYIFYSSGTTGLSKGVELTHHSIISVLISAKIAFDEYKIGRDALLGVLPFFHVFGGVIITLMPLSRGIPVIVLPRFEPASFLDAIQKYKVTGAYLAPPILLFLGKHPMTADYDLSSLRHIVLGAAPVSSELIISTEQKLRDGGAKSLHISQAFGLTETSAATHILPLKYSHAKVGSIGLLLPGQEARLVDDDDNDAPSSPPEQRGELWVRGGNIMRGYLHNPTATANSITKDGWFKTGDIATRDADGFFKIVDRKKELIKYKGFQVAPAELEALLISNPIVADCGVIGVFSSELETELPRAYLVPRDPSILTSPSKSEAFASEIAQWVASKVAQHKQLRGGVLLRESIPRSMAGKILRKDLRALAAKEDPVAKAKL